MTTRQKTCGAGRSVTLALSLAVSTAQAYAAENVAEFPSRPIRMIVPSTPGGSVDTLARSVSARLSERWKHQTIVDNRAGAGGVIGADTTAKAVPDGYTLIMATIASMATNVHLIRNLPYDPVKDFAPVTLVASQQLVLLVHPGVAAKSVSELIQLAKAKPGQLTFASAGSGVGGHLSAELFKLLAGIDMIHVPYKGVAPALVDVLSGQVNMTFTSIISGLPQIKSNRLRPFAVTGARRSPPLPEVPTMAEAGVRGYESSTWYGVLGPKALPRPIVMKLNNEIVAILKIPEVRDRLLNDGAEPVGNTPEQFGEFIKSEIVKWGKVFKAAGIKPE